MKRTCFSLCVSVFALLSAPAFAGPWEDWAKGLQQKIVGQQVVIANIERDKNTHCSAQPPTKRQVCVFAYDDVISRANVSTAMLEALANSVALTDAERLVLFKFISIEKQWALNKETDEIWQGLNVLFPSQKTSAN